MTDLKPCPFCGHPSRAFPNEKRKGEVTVGCYDICFANPRITVFGVSYEDAEAEAVDRWNRRLP